ncbi:hypothetical protein Tco_1507553 [Tanacetum coccineum]
MCYFFTSFHFRTKWTCYFKWTLVLRILTVLYTADPLQPEHHPQSRIFKANPKRTLYSDMALQELLGNGIFKAAMTVLADAAEEPPTH